MRIWVDADAAPGDVKDLVFRASRRLNVPTVLVANSSVPVPPGSTLISAVLVPGGANVADRHIADHAEPGDVAITADVPLAAALVAKNVAVIDPRGEEHTSDSIGPRLAARDLMDDLRGGGMTIRGPRPYSPKDRQQFAATFDRVLTRQLRRFPPP